MKMIAKTIKGKEFIYSKTDAYAVSNAGAAAICDALNAYGWQLKNDQCWHVYDLDWYAKEYTNAGAQKLSRRNGRISVSRYY